MVVDTRKVVEREKMPFQQVENDQLLDVQILGGDVGRIR